MLIQHRIPISSPWTTIERLFKTNFKTALLMTSMFYHCGKQGGKVHEFSTFLSFFFLLLCASFMFVFLVACNWKTLGNKTKRRRRWKKKGSGWGCFWLVHFSSGKSCELIAADTDLTILPMSRHRMISWVPVRRSWVIWRASGSKSKFILLPLLQFQGLICMIVPANQHPSLQS